MFVCVCVCVCVCVFESAIPFCVNVYSQFFKIQKNAPIWIQYFQSHGVRHVLLLLDLDLSSQGQTFGILLVLRLSRKW